MSELTLEEKIEQVQKLCEKLNMNICAEGDQYSYTGELLVSDDGENVIIVAAFG